MSEEQDLARKLVRDVILVQSNTFIKELLRSKGITRGTSKVQFEASLQDAITDGTLVYADLKAWVDEIEGWGDEHVYLHFLPAGLCSDAMWKTKDDVKKWVGRVGKLKKLWEADTSLEFPEERTLTGVYFDGTDLTCVWHQGTQFEQRVKDADFEWEDEADGDVWIYKAFRQVWRRNVARIVLRPSERIAAVFLPGAFEPKEHGTAREAMADELAGLVRLDESNLGSVANAIASLDSQTIRKKQPGFRAKVTRFSADGGEVEFSTDMDQSYATIGPLRKVRNAVSMSDFTGKVGEFFFQLMQQEKARDVRVNLYSDYQRVRMWVRLNRGDVWNILDPIRSALR